MRSGSLCRGWRRIIFFFKRNRRAGIAGYWKNSTSRIDSSWWTKAAASGWEDLRRAQHAAQVSQRPNLRGFPPIAIYSLGLKPATGSGVVAAGPHTVYYVRKHLTEDTPDTLSPCAETLDVADIREGYLAAFAD